jgi:hypothetical protein
LFLLALWIGVLAVAQGGEQRIVLREYLNQQWTNELLVCRP